MHRISLALVCLAVACARSPDRTSPDRTSPGSSKPDQAELAKPLTKAANAVDGKLLARALRALEPHLPKAMTLLEVRATPTSVEMQVIVDQGITALRYREKPVAPDAQVAVPTGVVDPPVQVPVYGNGNLAENGFLPAEMDLLAIASAFPVAVKAVDPIDGWIRELVVRRFLPFGSAVRARIYVESPRMSGSIDTTGKGIPLGPGRL